MAALLRVVHLVEHLVDISQLEIFDRCKELSYALVHLLVERLQVLGRRLLRGLLRLRRWRGCLVYRCAGLFGLWPGIWNRRALVCLIFGSACCFIC